MFAALVVPNFRLQAALRGRFPAVLDSPVALLAPNAKSRVKAIIDQVSPAAEEANIVPDMSVSQAQARCPELILQDRAPLQESIAATILRECAGSVSPYFEITSEGVCTLDLRGLAQEIKHEKWALPLIGRLAVLGLHARIGVGENPEVAYQAALSAKPFRQIEAAVEFLEEMPVSALHPIDGMGEVLALWGIDKAAQLAALPRDAVGERLGVKGLTLWDRAAGRCSRTVLDLWKPAETYEEAVELEYGVESLEPLLFLLRRLLGQLTARVANAYMAVAQLCLTLRCDNGQAIERICDIPAPTCNEETLFRVLFQYLENLQADAPIVSLRLSVRADLPANHQIGLFQSSIRDPNGFYGVLARLAAMLGQDRVGVPQFEASYRPDAFRLEPPRLLDQPSRAAAAASVHRLGPALRRYRPPIAVQVSTRDGRPAAVDSEIASGQVVEALGPWRISGDWWTAVVAWSFEEWDAQVAGNGLYRLGHESEKVWWVMGKYE